MTLKRMNTSATSKEDSSSYPIAIGSAGQDMSAQCIDTGVRTVPDVR